MEKRIEIVRRRVGDLKLDFGNPRKIKKQKREDLEESLEKYGDFDIIVINENDQVIGGNQRVTIFQKKNPDMIVECKMLIGYTVAEQKYINIKLNSHAGEWDLEELGDCLSSGDTPEEVVSAAELGRAIDRFLRTLPDKDCCIFLRRYWYLDAVGDIARRYHMAEGSVKSSLFRTRKKLREYLQQEGVWA